jgi:uncharacterized Tic20 family protein
LTETYATTSSTPSERTWALIAHLGGPAGILLSAGLFRFRCSRFVIYLAKRDDSEFAGDQAKEALNFQITLFLLHVAIWISSRHPRDRPAGRGGRSPSRSGSGSWSSASSPP